MLLCKKCLVNKEEEEFFFYQKKNKYHSACKACERKYCKEHYYKNQKKYIEKAKRWRQKERINVLEYLKLHPCVDCGILDIRVLQFDHLKNKVKSIANLIGRISKEKLWEEIAKCEVRCANCHIMKTSKDFNWYKYSENARVA